MKGLKKKHYEELMKVRKKEKYTKSNDFWAPLSQAEIIHKHYIEGDKQFRIDYIEIMPIGNFLLNRYEGKQK